MNAASFRDYPWQEDYETGVDNLLQDFYIPALSRAVRYDRKAGYFSSTALSVAARGMAHFLRNGGTMRLLVSHRLSAEDVQRIAEGMDLRQQVTQSILAQWQDPEDKLRRDRLGALAAMVAAGRLEIKVVFLADSAGRPIAVDEDHAIFHEKVGVLYDSQGDGLAFIGSINESGNAWLHNYESFDLYRSWVEPGRVKRHADKFERLWKGERPGTIVLDLPDALKQKLLEYQPPELPSRDPEEEPEPEPALSAADREAVLLRFIQDAPYLPGGEYLGAATARVDPLPHQEQVLRRVYESYPARFLLCDEVGLGKTIEAGLILRELVIHGLVRRVLILAPHGTLHQWQETLAERFALYFTRYTGRSYREVDGTESAVAGNPWEGRRFLLASSHLLRLRDRQPALLDAEPFDLIILDEAHHARRQSASGDEYRPNNLLRLLQQLQERTQGLLLCTATPMQLDPVEVWDLLTLVGLAGRWASHWRLFRSFFDNVRLFPDGQPDLVLQMVADALDHGVEVDPAFVAQAKAKLGALKWQKAFTAIRETLERRKVLADPDCAEALRAFALHHTPLRRFMCRNTRRLLKEYHEQGLIPQRPADRECQDQFVPLSTEEESLYRRIEEYLRKHFVSSLSGTKKGLGFVVNTYRRRLTSSSFAILETLRRRLADLEGKASGTLFGLTEDQLAEDDTLDELGDDVAVDAKEAGASPDAIVELRQLIADLERLPRDTKLEMLLADLQELMKTHHKALIFTQYRDTMLYLRDHLFRLKGSRIACYSGGGGEVWEDGAWRPVSKEELQRRFTETNDYELLLCTDSASEGLNLQTASLLINYDMPWNPMRVEQRIGRIDRLGQARKTVTIRNYYYRDTVEDVIYSRLRHRINLFEDVVGGLQPILARVPKLFELYYEKGGEVAAIQSDLEELLNQAEAARSGPFNLDELARPTWAPLPKATPPVTPAAIEAVLTRSDRVKKLCGLRPIREGIYALQWHGRKYHGTFRPELASSEVRYLTYGDPIFDAILSAAVNGLEENPIAGLCRQVAKAGQYRAIAYLVFQEGEWRPVATLDEMQERLRYLPVTGDVPNSAPDFVSPRASRMRDRFEAARQGVFAGQVATLRAQGRELLTELAAVLVAERQIPPKALGEPYDGTPFVKDFKAKEQPQAWAYLREHVAAWKPSEGLVVPVEAVEAARAQLKKEHINSILARLRDEAVRLVERLAALNRTRHLR